MPRLFTALIALLTVIAIATSDTNTNVPARAYYRSARTMFANYPGKGKVNSHTGKRNTRNSSRTIRTR